ncbi:tim10/DDP family zinc finger domain-containing protein [Moniliophthora roreri MCA 2997]|uniref:Mitochondrial import inner membrane translocase subunit n=1 Tax=Moniliophthora roreri (strain MCA 2997) TaxID=1381753 RepID=V2Y0I7_MONRO|nr:tim10/DDP family zinc finger domain-containing protein [Moniliophthora roreri MCA 2997]
MSDFFKNPLSSSSSPSDLNARKEAIMNQVRNELAQANAQQLMNNMNERCYKACVTKPGASLSTSEETCLARCLDRFMDTFNIVSRTYTARITRERLEEQGGPTTLSS